MRRIKIMTHQNETYFVDVETYDPEALVNDINSSEKRAFNIGDLVLSGISVKSAVPVDLLEAEEQD